MKKTIYLIGIAASIMGGITSCTLDAEDYVTKRGCLKINLRWPLLFYSKLKSFGFFSKDEFISLLLKISLFFCYHNLPKRLLLQDYVLLPAGRTQFQPS